MSVRVSDCIFVKEICSPTPASALPAIGMMIWNAFISWMAVWATPSMDRKSSFTLETA